jgi:hypothetical protein
MNTPSITHHEDIAPHLLDKNSSKRNSMTQVSTITMKHNHGRSTGNKL